MAVLKINGVVITDDGAVSVPEQVSVGDGGQIILHADGALEVGTGVAGFDKDGMLRLGCTAEPAEANPVPTHTLIVHDNAGRKFRLLAVLLEE